MVDFQSLRGPTREKGTEHNGVITEGNVTEEPAQTLHFLEQHQNQREGLRLLSVWIGVCPAVLVGWSGPSVFSEPEDIIAANAPLNTMDGHYLHGNRYCRGEAGPHPLRCGAEAG